MNLVSTKNDIGSFDVEDKSGYVFNCISEVKTQAIVKAVNEHAALLAVAEAARNLLNSTPSDNLKTPEQVSLLWKVEWQLQDLAAVRKS